MKKPKIDFLTVIHVNTRSLLRHFDDVSALVVAEHPHILALSETWLDDSVSDAQVHLTGYRLLRSDCIRCGGGVAVFCVENLHCSLLSCGVTSSGAEFCGFLLLVAAFNHLLLLAVSTVPLVLHHSLSMMFVIRLKL